MTDEEIKMNWLAICESGASMTAIHNLREHYKQLEKENAELKAQIEKMKCCEIEIRVKAKNRFLENLKLISPDVWEKYIDTDFVELRRCQNRLNQSKG